MACLVLNLILVIWIAWAIFVTKTLHKIFNKDLKHLFEPKVNLMAKNGSASRYDGIDVNQIEIYLGAIFLFPLRILIGLSLMFLGRSIQHLVWLAFGSKDLTNTMFTVFSDG